MKTPLQQLIEWIDKYGDNRLYGGRELTVHQIKARAKSLLEKEKSTIQQAFYEGMLCQGFDPNMGRAETYYNNVYKNSKQ